MSFLPAGSFREGDSVLHKMDPFCKLLSAFLLLAAVILSNTFPGYGLAAGGLLAVILVSRLGLGTALSGVKRMRFFFCLILLMNMAFYETEQIWWKWWIFRFSGDGLVQGMQVVLRVAMAMVLGNLLVSATSPLELVGAMESLMYPLKFIGVPIRDVAMILGVAIQFIPAFSEEAEMIRRAQTARGARFESRRLTEKAKSIVPLVVPIFLAAFRRADELAIAMEARGYRRTKGKLRRRRRRLSPADAIGLLLCGLLCAAEAVL